jgi:hypothetical protein
LEKLGVNVDGVSGIGARGLPLPIFDETQWDHVRDQPRDNEWEDVEKRERRDTGLHVLKKAGIVGKNFFPEDSHVYIICNSADSSGMTSAAKSNVFWGIRQWMPFPWTIPMMPDGCPRRAYPTRIT